MSNYKKTSLRVLSALLSGLSLFCLLAGPGRFFGLVSYELVPSVLFQMILGIIGALLSVALAAGFWFFKNWAKTITNLVAVLLVGFFCISAIFSFSTAVFAGEKITPLAEIIRALGQSLLTLLENIAIPLILIYGLKEMDDCFEQSDRQRFVMDQFIKKLLVIIATTSILVVILIFIFTFLESSEALENIGLGELLTGTVWRPGTSTGEQVGQFGLVPMILGSLYSTLGAVVLGVPLAILTAILLAEVAPPLVREIIRPAVELLAGIPSVIFGLFGVVVLAPMIRNIEIDGNSGFGILNASIILAIMILPTITSVAEDAIRAVPDSYRDASLAMGATRWQTIITVILPAARSGIIAAIILGIGRALGETMALIMVIGNSIAIPTPLNDNPLTILLATARTLTGNIAVEINYAADVHRSALFFTGVLLFLLLLGINRLAHFVMRERQPS